MDKYTLTYFLLYSWNMSVFVFVPVSKIHHNFSIVHISFNLLIELKDKAMYDIFI